MADPSAPDPSSVDPSGPDSAGDQTMSGHDTLVFPMQIPAGLLGRRRPRPAAGTYRHGVMRQEGPSDDPRRSFAPTPRPAPAAPAGHPDGSEQPAGSD